MPEDAPSARSDASNCALSRRSIASHGVGADVGGGRRPCSCSCENELLPAPGGDEWPLCECTFCGRCDASGNRHCCVPVKPASSSVALAHALVAGQWYCSECIDHCLLQHAKSAVLSAGHKRRKLEPSESHVDTKATVR